MNCPHCTITFQPQMEKRWIWNKKTNMDHEIYNQFCPGCNRLVVGIYEYSDEVPPPKENEAMKRLKLLKF